jgi:hypothetical protein
VVLERCWRGAGVVCGVGRWVRRERMAIWRLGGERWETSRGGRGRGGTGRIGNGVEKEGGDGEKWRWLMCAP